MSVTRVPQFPESVIRRGQANARNDLDVYSKAEVDAEIAGVDLSLYTPLSTTASISGGLDTRLDVVEADIVALESLTQDISGNLTIDINNVDLALTEKIDTDCVQSAGISGAGTTLNGHLIITINGVTYKLATVV